MVISSGESRRGKRTMTVAIGLYNDQGVPFTPLLFDSNDIADLAMACRMLGLTHENVWVDSGFSNRLFRVLADAATASEQQTLSDGPGWNGSKW